MTYRSAWTGPLVFALLVLAAPAACAESLSVALGEVASRIVHAASRRGAAGTPGPAAHRRRLRRSRRRAGFAVGWLPGTTSCKDLDRQALLSRGRHDPLRAPREPRRLHVAGQHRD